MNKEDAIKMLKISDILFNHNVPVTEARVIGDYIEELQQENKQLKEKINTYENPEDLTLMFMYCDEKAKDKIKQLKDELKNEESKVKSLKVALETRAEERDKYSSKCFLYKEVIEEVREVIDTYKYVENDDGMYEPILDGYDIQKLLQTLDKVKESDK